MLLSYWCCLIEGLQASPQKFYTCVEEALDSRQVPDLKRSRFFWNEGGVLSAEREYLRLVREDLLFDICTAPFGTGFFVSCRLSKRQFIFSYAVKTLLVFLTINILTAWFDLAANQYYASAIARIIFWISLVGAIGVLIWLPFRFHREIADDISLFVMSHPILAPVYEFFVGRTTYYRIDLTQMFHAAVQASVHEIIDKQCGAQNLRPLSEAERKPTFSGLLGK